MAVAWEGEVGVDLVADDDDIVSLADFSHAAQNFSAPYGTGGIVRGAHDKDLAVLGFALEVVEVYLESGVSAIRHHYLQRRAYQRTAAIFRQVEEGRVDGGGHQDFISRLREAKQRIADARHDAGDEMQILLGGLNVVVFLQPCSDSLPIAIGRHGITQHFMFAALTDGLQHKVRRAEVHISHPHGRHVVVSEERFQCIPFEAIGSPPFDNLVKVVLHFFLSILINLSILKNQIGQLKGLVISQPRFRASHSRA